MMKREKERCDHCRKWVIIGEGTDLTMLYTLETDLISHPRKMDIGGICGRCFKRRPIEDNVEYWTKWLDSRFPETASQS